MQNTFEVLDEIEGFINSGAISEDRVRVAIRELVDAERKRRQATIIGIKKSNELKLLKVKRFMKSRKGSPITVKMLSAHMDVQEDTARKYLKTLEGRGEAFGVLKSCDTREVLWTLFKPDNNIERPPAKRVYTSDVGYRVRLKKRTEGANASVSL